MFKTFRRNNLVSVHLGIFAIAALLVGCQTIQDTFTKVVDVNSVRPQKTILYPIVSKVTTGDLYEGPRKLNRMTPIFYENSVIVGNGVTGISRVSEYGQTMWSREIRNGVEASSVVSGSSLFVPANDGFIYKLNIIDGTIIEQVRTGAENLGDLTVSANGKVVYAQSSLGTIFAINAETMKTNWTFSRPDAQSSTIRGNSKVVPNGDRLFAGLSDGTIISLNAETGAVIWEKLLNRNKKFRDIDASPLISGGKMYVSAYDDKIYCMDLTGQILWQANYGGYGTPSIHDDMLFVPTSNNEVVALDKASGVLKWTFPTMGLPTEVKIVKGYGVFGSSKGPLYLVDIRQGKMISRFEPGRGIMSAPAVKLDKDMAAFISGEAVLYIVQVRRETKAL